MHEITAQYQSSNTRICQMPVRIFDGLVRVKKSETEEEAGGVLATTEFFRKVLSDRTIRAAAAFRAEIARAIGQIGFKAAPLGVLVDTRGLDCLKALERESKVKAAGILEMMIEDLAGSGESDNLARCEVDLIALKLHPDEEFAEQVEKLLTEALRDKFDTEAETLNRHLRETLESLAAGHALVAQKKLSMVGRFLTKLAETEGDRGGLDQMRNELAEAKEIVARISEPVALKIERMSKLQLFKGVKISPQFRV